MKKTLLTLILGTSCLVGADFSEKYPGFVKAQIKDRVYFKTEQLHVKKTGIYLEVDKGKMRKLPAIMSDKKGCYIKEKNFEKALYRPCPSCKTKRLAICENKECKLVGKKLVRQKRPAMLRKILRGLPKLKKQK